MNTAKGLFTRTKAVTLTVSVTVKVKDLFTLSDTHYNHRTRPREVYIVSSEGPSDGQNGCGTHSASQTVCHHRHKYKT